MTAGAKLYIAPVRARMVTDEALYVERHDPNGTIVGRLLNVEVAADGKKIMHARARVHAGRPVAQPA